MEGRDSVWGKVLPTSTHSPSQARQSRDSGGTLPHRTPAVLRLRAQGALRQSGEPAVGPGARREHSAALEFPGEKGAD